LVLAFDLALGFALASEIGPGFSPDNHAAKTCPALQAAEKRISFFRFGLAASMARAARVGLG
jgi:hypothetical protein